MSFMDFGSGSAPSLGGQVGGAADSKVGARVSTTFGNVSGGGGFPLWLAGLAFIGVLLIFRRK